jgi:hypothetical protein
MTSFARRGNTKRVRFARFVCIGAAMLGIDLTATLAHAEEVSEEARRHFKAGVALLHDPDGARLEEAYREFKTAYSISPSPRMLGNLGYCAMKLERDEEAIAAYTRYLGEAPDVEPSERVQVESDLLTMKSGLARVTLTIEEPGATVVDKRVPSRGDPIVNVYGPASGKMVLGIRQGHHLIEVKFGTGASTVWELDAMPGARSERVFQAPREEARAASRTPVVPIVVTTTGGLMLAAGAVTGFLAYNRAKRINEACPNETCPYGYGLDDARSTAQTLVSATDVLLVGGGVLAVAGLTWWILSPRGAAAPATGRLTPRLGCFGTGCSAGLSGSF